MWHAKVQTILKFLTVTLNNMQGNVHQIVAMVSEHVEEVVLGNT